MLLSASGVGGSVEQAVDIGGVGWLELEQPGGVGVLIDQLRRGRNGGIDFDHRAGDRRVDVGGGLDRFDHGGFLFGGERLADVWQFDENEVAEQFLRVVGDPDGDRAVSFDAG